MVFYARVFKRSLSVILQSRKQKDKKNPKEPLDLRYALDWQIPRSGQAKTQTLTLSTFIILKNLKARRLVFVYRDSHNTMDPYINKNREAGSVNFITGVLYI